MGGQEISQSWQRCRKDFVAFVKLARGMADNSLEAYLHDVDILAQFAIDNNIEPEDVKLDDLQLLLK